MPASSSSSIHLVEPHPHTNTPYIHVARGGAGNVANATRTTDGADATGPASRHPSVSSRKPKVFFSGRGGAGNLHHSSERAIFSFDEELEQQMRQMQDLAPVCHVGRGGAGNRAYINRSYKTCQDTASETTSIDSSDTADEGLGHRIRRTWANMTDRF